MQITTKKLTELIKPEKNIRIHTEQQFKEFERSIKMFGQIRPIVIDENNVILAGNGLYDTLLRMGYEKAEVYQYTDLTENQKKKLMIADNKIFSLGIENLDTLNVFIEELHDDLDIPGYDSEILRQMVSEAEDITEKLSVYGTLDDEEIASIREKNEKAATIAVQGQEGAPTMLPKAPNKDVSELDNTDNDTAETKRFVICPNCGEKVWL